MEIVKKIAWKEALEKMTKFFSTLSKVVIIVVAMGTGFAAGSLWHRYDSNLHAKKMQNTRTHKETSVAVNERGEVMIIDRKTGTYQVYSDTVGKMVFELYAGKMYYESQK